MCPKLETGVPVAPEMVMRWSLISMPPQKALWLRVLQTRSLRGFLWNIILHDYIIQLVPNAGNLI